MTEPPRLYSYERFSTPEQAAGDSLRRQTQKAEAYAAKYGLALDKQLGMQDLGVSGYHGRNFSEKSALGGFLAAVDDGRVPRGSRLGVENLDRITRETPYDAQALLREIFRRDITLVTFDDERIYSEQVLRDDFLTFMTMQMTNFRAHDESKRKAERIKASWVGKRARVGDQILTACAPAWLKVKRGKFVVVQKRAAVVRRIFELAADGMGLESIARTFNTERIPTFGKALYWHRAYIQRIVDSPASIGTFIPHTLDYLRDPLIIGKTKRIRRPLDPLVGYFPAVVQPELFQRVQAMRERRAPATRTATVRNVLAGLGVCGACGGSVTRVTKGSSGSMRAYLVCAKSKMGAGCKYVAMRYDPIEAAIRAGLQDGSAFRGALSTAKNKAMEDLYRVEAQIENVVQVVMSSPQPPIALRKKLDELEKQKAEIRAHVDALADPGIMRVALKRLESLTDWSNASEVNALLRQVFKQVILDYPTALVLQWKDGDRDTFIFLQ